MNSRKIWMVASVAASCHLGVVDRSMGFCYENFEGSFPGNYWFVGDANDDGGSGDDYWGTVESDPGNDCHNAGAGDRSAWCAANGRTDCTSFDNNMMAYMYVEGRYLGRSYNDTDFFTYWRWGKMDDQDPDGDFSFVRLEGYQEHPMHGIGNCPPDITVETEGRGSSNGWELLTVPIPALFDTMRYIRVIFYFQSNEGERDEGVYIDYIDFGGCFHGVPTRIDPIWGGFKEGTCCTDTECDDGNICTGNACSPEWKCETHDANGEPCDDGIFCNGDDYCLGGTCSFQYPNDQRCPGPNGDNDCSESCDEVLDTCTAPDPDGLGCNDGLYCNGSDTCSGGMCSVHAGDPCDPPTLDNSNCREMCNEATDDCTFPNNDYTPCDDEIFCNGADDCRGGVCRGHVDPPCGAPGNGDCSDGCDEESKECTAADPDGTQCDPRVYCHPSFSWCEAGICPPLPYQPSLTCPLSLNGDGNCQESCNEATGGCTAPDPDGLTCNDGSMCTTGDECWDGDCVGAPRNCDDGNLCTDDSCDPATGCVNVNNAQPCDDGDACTTADTCLDGVCVGGLSYCDDGNDCTDDFCDPDTGCTYVDNTASCDDGVFCNGTDTCTDGDCVHDGDPCLPIDLDSGCSVWCNEATGDCTAPNPVGIPCDDEDACTLWDQCLAGACVGWLTLDCDDGDLCTDDSCDPATGCVNTNNAAPCNDNVFCNGTDTCSGGNCAQHAGNPCPGSDGDNDCSETCNEEADDCTWNDMDGSACNDGLWCNGTDSCSGGNCAQHTGEPCIDLDHCDEVDDICQGCASDSDCDDGNPCTVDACEADQCQHAADPTCGGCCFTDGDCEIIPDADCAVLGGTYAGAGTNCGIVFNEDFESGDFTADWSFTYSTNGVQSGTNNAGTWLSEVVTYFGGLVGARLYADAELDAPPHGISAAIDTTVEGIESLSLGICFDAIQGTGALGVSHFAVTVFNEADHTQSYSYHFSTTGDVGPDSRITVSPASCVGLAADVAGDFFGKYQENLTGNAIIRFRAYADYAEGAGGGRRTTDVIIDDIQVSAGAPGGCQFNSPLSPLPPHDARKHRYLSIDPSTNPGQDTVIKVEIAEMMRCQNDLRRGCLVDLDCRDVCEDEPNTLCPTGPSVCPSGACIDSGPCVDVTPIWDRFSTGRATPSRGLQPARIAWFVQEPQQIAAGCLAPGCNPATENCCGDEDWVARLSNNLYVDANNWLSHAMIHISDCGIVPGVTYNVYACDPANTNICSEPLTVGTQATPSGTHLHFGDIAGPPINAGDPYEPPDGFVNVVDVSAWGLTKQNYGTPTPPQLHPTMADLHGSGYGVPANYILGLSDQQAIISHGFTWALPWDNPTMLGGVDPSTCPGRLP